MKKPLLSTLKSVLKKSTLLVALSLSANAHSQCFIDISIDSTINCFGDSTGALSVADQVVTPLMITEADRNSPDLIEIQNVTGTNFDATGYYVTCSDSYTDINIANSLTWNLSGIVPAGWIDYRIDNTGANYWGNNLFFSGGSPGWVAICDASHNVVDIFFWEWSAADIATFAPVVAGNTLILDPTQWVGDGLTGGCSSGSMVRSTNIETNTNADWTCGSGATAGISNITISPATGDPIVSVLWSTMETTFDITNLAAGTYGVQVTFQGGCVAFDSVSITEPAALTASTVTTDVLCFGDSNGTALALASGGTGPITVDWGANDPNALSGGYSAYSMTDSLGCMAMDSVLINEPAVLDITLTAQNILCFGDSIGGSADAVVTGGTPSYVYSWSNGDNTSTTSGLSAGWYGVSVVDTNGCTVQDSVEITEPAAALSVSGTTTDEISGTDGSIDLTVGGGTSPYTYAWTNGAPAVEDPTGLVGGTYDVTVTDANGCTITGSYVVNSQVGISELDQLQFNVFPNPNSGEFKLTLNSHVDVNVHVLNSLGQVIYKDALSGSSKEIKLDAAQVGVYFIRLFNDELSTVRRVVIK
ncbi:MAG: T9SS type A sorting domain-containing protein [Crocinitomicaceae bacterium]